MHGHLYQIALPILGLMAVILILGLANAQVGAIPVKAKKLLTGPELSFFAKLMDAAHGLNLYVCPQVSMGAIMQPIGGLDARTKVSVRNRFSSKIVDFALINEQANVVLLIELDDRSHIGREDHDRRRDQMTAAAGLKTLRIRDGKTTTSDDLAHLIREAVRPPEARQTQMRQPAVA